MPGNILITATARALITGFNPDRVAVTRSIKIQFFRGAPASLKPLITPALTNTIGNLGALASILREIGAVTWRSFVQVVNKGKSTNPKGVTSWVLRKQAWNDCVQASIPLSETNVIAISELFHRQQKLAPIQKS